MRNVALPLALLATASHGWGAEWIVLQSAEWRRADASVAWHARLEEEHLPQHRLEASAGASAVRENTSRRRLTIEVFDGAGQKIVRRMEHEVPSETSAGDSCSTRGVQLAAANGLLELEAEHSFACGAGSGTLARYKIAIQPDANRITYFEVNHASREVTTSIQVDYLQGRLSTSKDRPEDAVQKRPVVRRIPQGAVVLGAKGLLGCPKPLRGDQIRHCRA